MHVLPLLQSKISFTPTPASEEEIKQFHELQLSFTNQFNRVFPDPLAPKTIVVVPSLTLDQEVLSKVNGALHYEERLLCLLMLLRMPCTHVIYVSSMPIDPVIIDYYLHLLPGITGYHARERLTLLSCYDPSPVSLTEKILNRPRLLHRIKKSITPGHATHIACFNVTGFERTLAVQLNIPLYGCDPAFNYFGTKSGSRELFRRAGVLMPDGSENLHSYDEIVEALCLLKHRNPALQKALVKLNDGFSGDGNAVFRYPSHMADTEMAGWINLHLMEAMKPVAANLSSHAFMEKFNQMGGITEAFVEGSIKTSPSVQCRINPQAVIEIVSTHDQQLDPVENQVFIGAHFPAHTNYSRDIAGIARRISHEMAKEGILGRYSIDFISVNEGGQWKHYAIEINLRKGGTTHPYLMMQYLTNGSYNEETGVFTTPSGQQRAYFASDNLQHESYKGLIPQDLIDMAMYHGLHFDGATQKGVMFHMIGALSQFGKMGIVCIGENAEEAFQLYLKTEAVLNLEQDNAGCK